MIRHRRGRLIVFGLAASVLAFIPCALLPLLTAGLVVATEDRNADGKPDLWRHFDRRGRVASVQVDTNFDGRSDVQEFYDAGQLVRRNSDRNFNNQVDLVQEFDLNTQAQISELSDVDFDGQADELVLYADGQPAFAAHWPTTEHSLPAPAAPAMSSEADAQRALTPLTDPFDGELTMRGVRHVEGQHLDGGPPASNDVLWSPVYIARPFSSGACIAERVAGRLTSPTDRLRAPRGPPASRI